MGQRTARPKIVYQLSLGEDVRESRCLALWLATRRDVGLYKGHNNVRSWTGRATNRLQALSWSVQIERSVLCSIHNSHNGSMAVEVQVEVAKKRSCWFHENNLSFNHLLPRDRQSLNARQRALPVHTKVFTHPLGFHMLLLHSPAKRPSSSLSHASFVYTHNAIMLTRQNDTLSHFSFFFPFDNVYKALSPTPTERCRRHPLSNLQIQSRGCRDICPPWSRLRGRSPPLQLP